MNLANYFYGIIGNLCVGVGILLLIIFLKRFKNTILKFSDYLTSVTVGLLLGIVFLGFFPEIFESSLNKNNIGTFVLLGILIFYIFELFIHWHHCKDLFNENESQGHHTHSNLMFIGTFLHNLLHSVEIYVAFGINKTLGVITVFAILLHSIPQNVANFLLNIDKSKKVFLASFAGVIGSVLIFPFIGIISNNLSLFLCFISGGLLYISLTDLFGEIKNKGNLLSKIIHLLNIILGVLLFFCIKILVGIIE